MNIPLPKLAGAPVPLPHFPTRWQAFVFRASEFFPARKIAAVLKTTEQRIRDAMEQMGLCETPHANLWLEKGYITIIRSMWHILPYSQLLELLEMDEPTLAFILKEEDFLDIKLGNKPDCAPLVWSELTESEQAQTATIQKIMRSLALSGAAPFDFHYTAPKLTFGGKANFDTRMIYAFSGLYQHAFDVDSEIFCPDSQLAAYRDLGINGIWAQATLSQLTVFPFEPSVSTGYEQRLERMKRFTQRLDRFGLKLYLYINEPRYMPLSFFDKHPDIKGHVDGENACLCTSAKPVQDYLKNAVAEICRAVPLLGGFFTITRSENLTNCFSHSTIETCTCPRCSRRSMGEVIGEVIGLYAEGARSVNPDIKIFAWSWGWGNHNEEIIRHLPQDIILMSQSELDIPFCIGGVEGRVLDYSMGIIGPGERARKEWQLASARGLETAAKVQISTTWEASTVPAIPVSPLISEHIRGIKQEGVRHLLVSWTLGGYPSANIAAAAEHFYETCSYSAKNSATYAAEQVFSRAFREFPFYVHVLYYGPHNAGPSNLLWATPTGYPATMTCFSYDDLESWRQIYPEDVFEAQFEKLCAGWEKGLSLLPENETSETAVMARATYCLFRSSLNQIRFIRARSKADVQACKAAAESELDVAKTMLALMNQNAAIGFEAANHYYFSKFSLAEKILNCHDILKTLS